jgi:hypothetical protein
MPHSPHHLNEGEINVADSPARPALVAGGPIEPFFGLNGILHYWVGFAAFCSSGRNRLKTDPLQPGFSVLRSVSDP